MPWPWKSTLMVSRDRDSVRGSTSRSTLAPDGAVEAADTPGVGRVDAHDLGRRRTLGATDATGGDALVSDLRHSLPIHAAGDNAVLPFVEVCRVDSVGEHLVRRPVDVNRDRGGRHRLSSVNSDAYRLRYSGHPASPSMPSCTACHPGPCRSM